MTTQTTTWTTYVNNAVESMRAVAQYLQPEMLNLEACLELDKFSMIAIPDTNFVWVLRESSTSIIPLKRGVSPLASAMTIGKGMLFSVSPEHGVAELISEEAAMELIREPAVRLNELHSENAVIGAVNTVLTDFQTMVFDRPDYSETQDQWDAWKEFFGTIGRNELVEFINDANFRLETIANQ